MHNLILMQQEGSFPFRGWLKSRAFRRSRGSPAFHGIKPDPATMNHKHAVAALLILVPNEAWGGARNGSLKTFGRPCEEFQRRSNLKVGFNRHFLNPSI
jgi:hypothetical protein